MNTLRWIIFVPASALALAVAVTVGSYVVPYLIDTLFSMWMHCLNDGGSEPRAKSIAELAYLHHELLTSTKTGDLLAEAVA